MNKDLEASNQQEQLGRLRERMQQAVISNPDPEQRSKLYAAISGVVQEMRTAGCDDVQIYLITLGAVALLSPTDTAATNMLMSLVCTNCGIPKMETNPAALPNLDRVAAETQRQMENVVPPDITDEPN